MIGDNSADFSLLALGLVTLSHHTSNQLIKVKNNGQTSSSVDPVRFVFYFFLLLLVSSLTFAIKLNKANHSPVSVQLNVCMQGLARLRFK